MHKISAEMGKSMREKLQRFMIGRYGVDEMGRIMLWVFLGIMLIGVFTNYFIINFIGFAGVIWCYFRMFSKNVNQRYKENIKFIQLKNKIKGVFGKQKYMNSQKKENHIFSCPNCKQKIRVPRGKGKISITCPKCSKEFIKNS